MQNIVLNVIVQKDKVSNSNERVKASAIMNHYLNQGKTYYITRGTKQHVHMLHVISGWQLNVNCTSKIWDLKLAGQQFSWRNTLDHSLSFFYFISDHRSFTAKTLINKENWVRFFFFRGQILIACSSCGSSLPMSYFSLRKTNSGNHICSSLQSFYNAFNQFI